MVTDPQLVPREPSPGLEDRPEPDRGKVRRTVDDILAAFKSSQAVGRGSRPDLSAGACFPSH